MNGIVPEPTGLSGRPRAAFFVLPEDLPLLQKSSATIHKTRENGRVTKIDYRTVYRDEFTNVETGLRRPFPPRKEVPPPTRGQPPESRKSRSNRTEWTKTQSWSRRRKFDLWACGVNRVGALS